MAGYRVLLAALMGLFLIASAPVRATVGLDISSETCQGMSSYDWQCLVNSGYDFAIIEAWQGGYQLDGNIAGCIADAYSAGMAHVDVYIFMCPECYGNDAYSVVQSVANAVSGTGYGMVWFDIEQCSGCWYGDLSDNANFIQQAVNEAESLGLSIGFYASAYEWSVTMGDYTTAFSGYPIWYADYDYSQSFYDFEPFGGWTTPAIKQYQGDYYTCNVGIDLDWYPDGTDLSWRNTTRAARRVVA